MARCAPRLARRFVMSFHVQARTEANTRMQRRHRKIVILSLFRRYVRAITPQPAEFFSASPPDLLMSHAESAHTVALCLRSGNWYGSRRLAGGRRPHWPVHAAIWCGAKESWAIA